MNVKPRMKQLDLRPLISGLIATLLGSLVGAFLLTLFGFTGPIEAASQLIGGTAAVGLYGSIIAVPFVFLYGMPLYALLRRHNAANYLSAVMVGALPGVAWVSWTRSSVVDPVLWNGVLIAFFYVTLRRRHASA